MLTTAYFGLLRVEEITDSEHVLKAKNVHIGQNINKLRLVLESSKTHGKDRMPQIIKLVDLRELNNQNKLFPFTAMQNYLTMRKQQRGQEEPFFVFKDRTPVSTYEYRKMLKKIFGS